MKRTPSFHKTDSLDYIVILSGQLTMLMDDDDEVLLGAGDVLVQQGVMHGWRVEGDEPVRMFAVLVSGETAALPLRFRCFMAELFAYSDAAATVRRCRQAGLGKGGTQRATAT